MKLAMSIGIYSIGTMAFCSRDAIIGQQLKTRD
uniref:Uncharacterized protein n=1 Tax=Ralstonia solanacearum TaxID=305 RepID=A0A0S4WH58_RALSL|nr:protein of unknown function [Ralstonia solanacearum]